MSAPTPSSSPLTPGYRLDRYELLCPIAEGGMAAVWLARFKGKHGFEKLVVVKTILPSYASDAQFRRMFLDEARIASRIEHHHVAQTLDLGEHEGTLYLVMEWVDGASVSKLDRAVRQAGGVPLALALRIVSDACAGLHAAHELRDAAGRSLAVVHRDVSPENILVSSQGVVKVIDFGIAKARDRAAEETRSGVFKGKLHYMAPEQALGKALDRRADAWAAAAVLYRLLAGRYVYDNGNRAETLQRLSTNAPIAPLPAHVSKNLSETITKALSFEPAARQESCAALQHDLESAMKGLTLDARPGDLGSFLRRHLREPFETRRQTIAWSLKKRDQLDQASPSLTIDHNATIGAGQREGAHSSAQASASKLIWRTTLTNTALTIGSTLVDQQSPDSPRRTGPARAVAALAATGVLAAALWFTLRAESREQIGTLRTESVSAPGQARQPVAVPTVGNGACADLPLRGAGPLTASTAAVVSVDSLPVSKTSTSARGLPHAAPYVGRKRTQRRPKHTAVDDGF